MSSISLPLKMLIAGSALAGFTLLACGGDDSGSKDTDQNGASSGDAGNPKDSGAKKDAGATTVSAIPGDDCSDSKLPVAACTGCGASSCVTRCGGDGTWGDCTSIAAALGDAGFGGLLNGDGGGFKLPDSGLVKNADGGFSYMVGDSSVALPSNVCPSSLMCSTSLAQYGFPAICASASPLPGVIPDVPPTCTSADDCTKMGLTASVCQTVGPLGMLCLGVCTP